jgi:hypothetical protein
MLNVIDTPQEILDVDPQPQYPEWLTPIQDVKILIWLCKKVSGNIVEIGTHKGHTTAILANTFPDRQIYTFDLIQNNTMDENQEYENPKDLFGMYTKRYNNVMMFNQDSSTIEYDQIENLGIIFIDGNHSYEMVKKDSLLAISSNVEIIVWHDFYYTAAVHEWVGVDKYLNDEIIPYYNVTHFKDSGIAYLEKT